MGKIKFILIVVVLIFGLIGLFAFIHGLIISPSSSPADLSKTAKDISQNEIEINPDIGIIGGATYLCAPRDNHQYYRTDKTLVIDPVNPNTLYVNVEHKGFFKSVDGGKTWVLKTKGIKTYGREDDPAKPCYGEYPAALIDPKNSNHIILALSGTPSTFDFGYTKIGGIVASIDGAENWKQIIDNWMNIYVTDIAIDPTNSEVLYYGTVAQAASYTGADPNKIFVTKGLIYKTQDGGENWEELPTDFIKDGSVTAIYINPENSQEILVTTYRAPRPEQGQGRDTSNTEQMGFLKSFDGGQTWDAIHSLPNGFEAVLESVISSNNYGHIFVSPYAPFGEMPKSFYSTDGASSFHQTNIVIDIASFDPHDETGNHLLGYQRTTTGMDLPSIYESNDAGATWIKVSNAPMEIIDNIALLNQASKIVWDPIDKNTVYLSGAGGYVWKSIDKGKSWETILTLDKLPE